ncbi:MAG: rane fusion protein multidrug efflux system [Alphaproteobacteria bacterium]|jgi:multidrug efflux system membrane fusion protein|nr:rane fusion protein multidrug efflux system [Alphaproteobacteria bacterium]
MRKRFLGLAVLSIAAIGVAAGYIHLSSKTAPPPAAPPAVPVVAGTVTQHDVPIYLSGVGTVIAYNTVLVRSQISGQIISINFTEGQVVHKGDLLAQIDPRPYQAQLDQAVANRDRDQAQLANAQANLNRYTPLAAKGYATTQLVDTQKAQLAQLQAMVKADEAVIEMAQTNLSYTRLTAPIDSVTGIRQIDIGNVIHPTDPNGLVIVTQVQPISLIFTLPETVLPQIQQQREKDKNPLTVVAYNQDNTIKLDEGTLGLVNNQIIQTTGSIQLKANFANTQRRLWPGQLVNARLLLDTRHDGLTVPASVVQQGPKGPYAYVINPNNVVEIRPITVAQITDGQALIDSGLKADEQVVVDGQYKLEPGTRVTLLTGKAAEEAKAQSALQAPIP